MTPGPSPSTRKGVVMLLLRDRLRGCFGVSRLTLPAVSRLTYLPAYLPPHFPASPPPHLPVSRIAGGEIWPRLLRSGFAFICLLRRNVGHASTSMSPVICPGLFIGSHHLRICSLGLRLSAPGQTLTYPRLNPLLASMAGDHLASIGLLPSGGRWRCRRRSAAWNANRSRFGRM
jgi:hypothetical protein